MNPSNLIRFAAVSAVFALVGCSPPPTGVYKGSVTGTVTFNGKSETLNQTGSHVLLFAGDEPNTVIVESGEYAFLAKREGDSLMFEGGQTATMTTSAGTQTETLVSGTGTLGEDSLSLNWTLSTTKNSNGQNITISTNVNFTGSQL